MTDLLLKIKIARDLTRRRCREYGYVLAPAKGFEPLTPCFVGKCSDPAELRGQIEFESLRRFYRRFIQDLPAA